MKQLELKTSPEVALVFERYPEAVRKKMMALRKLVIATANELEGLTHLEETLKWGEPSYVTQHGSTLRMDWKPKKPQQYALYFKCTSRLVETFRTVFKEDLRFEGKRAIVFQMDDTLPLLPLKECIKAALTYHKVKQLPNLGLQQKIA